jgi:hypothetical protein
MSPPSLSRRRISPRVDRGGAASGVAAAGRVPGAGAGLVAVDVDAEHAFEVSAVEDQQPVEALCTHGTDEAFGDSVRVWCADRGADDPDLFAAEDLVEGAGVLAVAVADQETDLLLGEEEAEVASWVTQLPSGLVVQPARWTRPCAVLDEEEHVEAAQEDALYGEEVTRATMLAACWCRNSRQLGPACRGAGCRLDANEAASSA